MTLPEAVALADKYQQAGQTIEARDLCQRVLAVYPTFGPALEVLAKIALQSGQPEDAARFMREAASGQPDHPGYWSNLGMILAELGRAAEAREVLERAVSLAPDMVEGLNNLANVYLSLGRASDAIATYRRVLTLMPNYVPAMNNLSGALNAAGDLDGAIEQSLAVLAIQPNHVGAMLNLGRAYKEAGRIDDALNLYRQADSLQPDPRSLSDLLFTMHFHPDYDARRLLLEHSQWNQRYAVPLRPLRHPLPNDRSPTRPLRIGYVAYDVGSNALGRFFLPFLSHHDRASFEVYCYCDIRRPDHIGDQLAQCARGWRVIRKLSDQQIVQSIRDDRIDILVDLSMHSHGNHLAVFAQKPAPIQITYLAYCSTTGVETIDYRLTDPHLDPPGLDESVYAEKSLRLPQSYWCYPEPPLACEVNTLPAQANGYITFGCLNDFAKVTPIILDAWQQLLLQLPSSRLILHCKNGAHRRTLLDRFSAAGVDPSRIELVSYMLPVDYFKLHHRIDIALDPFPWAGGTTTCDALWMGVPVVTLTGQTAVSRGGASILSNVNLPDLITRSPEAYIQKAIALSNDLDRLAALRSTLRPTMMQSPLMNAPQFTRDLEILYRRVWQSWCASQTTPALPHPSPE
jgi:predicted O-linked N-acetylglucosamine transferase (SPINDLY family)